ncbi:hypothetical protein HPQ64_04135 [Rhizobiales bacterium]|uniref:hypothetical protein n=1 Tax=Hongsoonwoonella zoysiae TaxID=2821844 RepID=UPI001561180B|nr:hypothetical protein [Hongsoonwoonella zoysiae]NRG16877.1 hypothetical protein [Hongsoonwoonella zoysiae]
MSDTVEKIAPFLGTWLLDHDESEFDQSAPPQSASCRIEEEFGLVRILMTVVEADGEKMEAEISGVPDGPETRMSESGLIDRLSLYFEGERTLTSEGKRKGLTLMRARRTLSEDGRSLEIEQTVEVPGEGRISNSAVYKRAQ